MSRDNEGKATAIVTIIFLVLFTIGGCIRCSGGCNDNMSTGKRTGQVVKLSYKGLLIKSWEGTLHLGNGATATGANSWDFSATDKVVIEKLQAALDSGKPVIVQYKQWWHPPIGIETNYEIVAVEQEDAVSKPRSDAAPIPAATRTLDLLEGNQSDDDDGLVIERQPPRQPVLSPRDGRQTEQGRVHLRHATISAANQNR